MKQGGVGAAASSARSAHHDRDRGISDWQDARHEHTRIAKAIADRAPERAEQLVRAHVERSHIALRTGFDGAGLTGSAPHARPQPTPARPAF